MKKLLFFTFIAVMLSATLVVSESQALNPFITSQYTADPSAHVFDPDPYTIYVYPSHDRDNAEWYDMVDYHVYSSTDLKKWTDHGVILHPNDVPWKPVKWMWAPDCAYKNGNITSISALRRGKIRLRLKENPMILKSAWR